jgi:hypothetical protein
MRASDPDCFMSLGPTCGVTDTTAIVFYSIVGGLMLLIVLIALIKWLWEKWYYRGW